MLGFLFHPPIVKSGTRETIQSFETEAVVQKIVRQGKVWRVGFAGTSWEARCEKEVALVPGDIVHVVNRHNLTLMIESMESLKAG